MIPKSGIDLEEPIPPLLPTAFQLDVTDSAIGFKNKVVAATIHFGPHYLYAAVLDEPAVLKHIR
jgi:hypothetical protein